MKVYVIYNSYYAYDTPIEFVVGLKDNVNVREFQTLVANTQNEYYELPDSEKDETCVAEYLREKLAKLGYEILSYAGDYDLA